MAKSLNISQGKQEELLDTVVGWTVKIGLVGGAIWVGKKWVDNANEIRVDSHASTNPNIAAAIQFRHGINPSGFDWLIGMDGTNYEAILEASKMVQDFAEVQKAYRLKYGGSLINALTKDLTPMQYTKAMSIVRQTEKGGSSNTTYPPEKHLYKKSDGVILNSNAIMKTKITNKAGFEVDSNYTAITKIISLHYLTLTYPDGTSKKELWYKVDGEHKFNPFADVIGYIKESDIKGKTGFFS